MVLRSSARLLGRPMRRRKMQFNGSCCAPNPMKGRASLRMLPLSAGRRPRAGLRRQPVATQAISRSRRAWATRRFISSSARQRGEKGGRICRCSLGSLRDCSSRRFRSPSQLARSGLRSWWLSGPNNRRKNIAQRIPSCGWILKAAGIISIRARPMAMREQAATPAVAKRNWLACAQWRTDRFGVPMFGSSVQRKRGPRDPKLAVIGWYRFGSEMIDVAAPCRASGSFPRLLQRRSAKVFAVISPTRLRESRDSATQADLVAVIFLMEYQRKQPAPIDALKTERRAITGGSK
jgi:hypothetical protein